MLLHVVLVDTVYRPLNALQDHRTCVGFTCTGAAHSHTGSIADIVCT
jgi:hypothetical protein